MTSKIAVALITLLSFFLTSTSFIFALFTSNEELFEKYRHWLRLLLFASAVAWLCISIAMLTELITELT